MRTQLKTEFGLPAGNEALVVSAAQGLGDTMVNAAKVVVRARNDRRDIEFCIAV